MGAGERGIAARGHALVDRLISWPVGQGGKDDVQRCKAERSSCAKVQKWEARLVDPLTSGPVDQDRQLAGRLTS
jgi:hypothetical protein